MTKAKRDELRPYLAVVLYRATDPTLAAKDLLKQVAKEIQEEQLSSTQQVSRKILSSTYLGKADGLEFQAIVVKQETTPAWDVPANYSNVSHELIVVAVHDSCVAICSSDPVIRNQLSRKLKSARPMSPKSFAQFVGPEAVTIWLNGAHTPTVVKPNSKILSGQALEYALDPIGDQSYGFSAIRSRPAIHGLAKNVIGTSPSTARVWAGRAPTWTGFSEGLSAIIAHALSKKRGSKLYNFLAQSVLDDGDVKSAYAVAVVPTELLSDDDIAEAERLEARRWAYDARFDIVDTDGPSLELEPYLDRTSLGRAHLDVKVKDGSVTLTCKWLQKPAGLDTERDRCEAVLTDPEKLKIYYGSGYTIMHGRCYTSGFTDQPFDWEFVDTRGFEIGSEKPTLNAGETLAGKVGTNADNSLFGFVVRKLYSRGWLACDDGSMELADFVHVDPTKAIVTLIHVKKSGNVNANREVSVADYEVVASQAVKNIRHVDRSNLMAVLRTGKGKKIGAAVWENGQRRTRDQFLAIVDALPPTAEKAVVILQPRVTDREVELCRQPGVAKDRLMRMRQLNALMLSARLSVMSCGARFRVYGQKL